MHLLSLAEVVEVGVLTRHSIRLLSCMIVSWEIIYWGFICSLPCLFAKMIWSNFNFLCLYMPILG